MYFTQYAFTTAYSTFFFSEPLYQYALTQCISGLMMISKTRKPCYRKDDRAMRHIAYMGALKNFGSPWLCPQLIFPTF